MEAKQGFVSIILILIIVFLGIGALIYRENTKKILPRDTSISTNPTAQTEFEKVFVKQPKGTETVSSRLDPFNKDSNTSNITSLQEENLLFETKLETVEKDNKLYDFVYLVNKNTQKQAQIFSKQVILYQ